MHSTAAPSRETPRVSNIRRACKPQTDTEHMGHGTTRINTDSSALRRFLKYVTYDTRSDEQSTTFPSTPGQLVLLRELVSELQTLGLRDATMDDYGYVMATVAATPGREHTPVIGFIAHVD